MKKFLLYLLDKAFLIVVLLLLLNMIGIITLSIPTNTGIFGG